MEKKRWYAAYALGMAGTRYDFNVWASSRNHAKRLARARMKSYECIRFEFLGEVETWQGTHGSH